MSLLSIYTRIRQPFAAGPHRQQIHQVSATDALSRARTAIQARDVFLRYVAEDVAEGNYERAEFHARIAAEYGGTK